jgi:nicotinamide-nucleotide amidase
MKCSIVNIGTELNLGLIFNTNSKYIAESLTELGIECNFIYTVRDDEEEISVILKESLKHSDIVIANGGLGPTDDDVTRNGAASALGLKLLRDKSLDETSLKFIKNIKSSDIKNRLLRQSYIPQNSIPIKPRVGSASGFIINLKPEKKWIFCIPGVPKEMKSMFDTDVIPVIKTISGSKSKKSGNLIIKKSVLMTTDISETEIEEKIKGIVKEAEKINVKIGITAAPGLIKIILVSMSDCEENCSRHLRRIEGKVKRKLREYIYNKNNTSISESLKGAIIRKNKNITISVAESITGGLVSSMITDTGGSSEYFLGGMVSYSNYAKNKLLQVNSSSIGKYGAVSREVCLEMACNVKKLFNSDFAVSTTGFAGPGATEKSKDVGLVYCCIIGPNDYRQVFKKKFTGSRIDIKYRTAQFILNKLRISIEETID